jgi:hypothetical protein
MRDRVFMMNRQAKIVLILLAVVTMIAGAQSPREDQSSTRARDYWIDPTTGLMWMAKDSGKAVTWHKATSYCRNLRLAGYPDWRLATLDELASLVDKSAPVPQRIGNSETFNINIGRHVRGNVSLTGDPWSTTGTKIVSGILTGRGGSSTSSLRNPHTTCSFFATRSMLCVCVVPVNEGIVTSLRIRLFVTVESKDAPDL